MRQDDLTVTVPLSGTISDDIDLRGGRLVAIAVPVIDSGDLLIRGAFDSTSASFTRVLNPGLLTNQASGGDLRFATGPGSRMLLWPALPSPSYARLETAVAQSAARVFIVRFSSA